MENLLKVVDPHY